MTKYRDMLTTIHDRVAALKKEGKSIEEAIAAKVTAAYDSKWATSFLTGDVFTKLVYAGAWPPNLCVALILWVQAKRRFSKMWDARE